LASYIAMSAAISRAAALACAYGSSSAMPMLAVTRRGSPWPASARRPSWRARATSRLRLAGAGQQDRELVSPQARDDVAAAQAAAQQLGHAHDQAIAGLVAEGVVDELEVVEVQGEQGGGRG